MNKEIILHCCKSKKCIPNNSDEPRFPLYEYSDLNSLKRTLKYRLKTKDDIYFYILEKSVDKDINKTVECSKPGMNIGCFRKFTILIRIRPNHYCKLRYSVIGLIIKDAVPKLMLNRFEESFMKELDKLNPTKKTYSKNKEQTCTCNFETKDDKELPTGQIYSIGCTYLPLYSGCCFSRSKHVKKYQNLSTGKYFFE